MDERYDIVIGTVLRQDAVLLNRDTVHVTGSVRIFLEVICALRGIRNEICTRIVENDMRSVCSGGPVTQEVVKLDEKFKVLSLCASQSGFVLPVGLTH